MSHSSIVFDDTTVVNTKMMDMVMERQRVIANNISNANTLGYIRQELDFEGRLKDIIKSGDLTELGALKGKVVDDLTHGVDENGNNVAIPVEMNTMMQNNVLYGLLNRAFNTRMSILRSAIK
jgi:flagellar basal-body rod protein FlgB